MRLAGAHFWAAQRYLDNLTLTTRPHWDPRNSGSTKPPWAFQRRGEGSKRPPPPPNLPPPPIFCPPLALLSNLLKLVPP